MNSNKTKGDRAEREAAELLQNLTGYQIRRALGAGRTNESGGDVGDLEGIPGHSVQIANWKNTASAAIKKPPEAEQQRKNANKPFAATLVRFRGGTYRGVLTPEQWAKYIKLIFNP